MIKLDRNFTPVFFNPSNVQKLTEKFKTQGSHVWQSQDVKNACLKLGNNKCAFCEVILDQKSTYMEVEHFQHKDHYPDNVIEWNNLLPSCRHCNGSKGTHDVVKEPIINPCIDKPAEHFYMKGYRLKGKTPLGVMTEEVLDINNITHYVTERCRVGTFISESIEEAEIKYERYKENPIPQRLREVRKVLRILLLECQNTALFSAVSATVLHDTAEYATLKEKMLSDSSWTVQLDELHHNSLQLKLPTTK